MGGGGKGYVAPPPSQMIVEGGGGPAPWPPWHPWPHCSYAYALVTMVLVFSNLRCFINLLKMYGYTSMFFCHFFAKGKNLRNFLFPGQRSIYNRDEQLSRQTRHSHPLAFRQIHTTANYYKYSFFPLSIVYWNRLPAEVVTLPTLDQFSMAVRSLDHRLS